MTAFIRQEAMEKAREIHLKADEEFSIEKSNLVRQETNSIDAQYEKKFKQAGMSQQITKSTLANKTRLRILSARQELLDDLFEKARGRLGEGAKDKGKYQETCKNLILEGMYALNEKKIVIRCKKGDDELVNKAIEDAKKEYKENVGKDIEAKIDDKERIADDRYVLPSDNTQTSTKTCTALAVSRFSTAQARSTSTTLLKSASNCSKPTLCPAYGQRCSARTRTESSTTELAACFLARHDPSSHPAIISSKRSVVEWSGV